MQLLINDDLLLTRSEFKDLLEYSTTLPTGTIPGKCWKRRQPFWAKPEDAEWWRGSYGLPYPEGHQHHGQIPIGWRRIRVAGTPPRWPMDVRVPLRQIDASSVSAEVRA